MRCAGCTALWGWPGHYVKDRRHTYTYTYIREHAAEDKEHNIGEKQQRQAAGEVQLQLAEEPVTILVESKYLGSTVMSDCGLYREIDTWIMKAFTVLDVPAKSNGTS